MNIDNYDLAEGGSELQRVDLSALASFKRDDFRALSVFACKRPLRRERSGLFNFSRANYIAWTMMQRQPARVRCAACMEPAVEK